MKYHLLILRNPLNCSSSLVYQAFVNLYMARGVHFVKQVGHVALLNETYAGSLKYFRENKLGTVFDGASELRINAEKAIHGERKL